MQMDIHIIRQVIHADK